MNQTAVIYDRASDIGQKDNWSRQDAAAAGERLAKENGFSSWEIRQEVKSGEELANRPVMIKLLEDIEAGQCQAIICQNLSRLSRDEDGIDGRYIKKICRENNCLVITPEMVYDFSQEAHDDMSDFQFLAAKWYKRAMMKQVAQGLRARAAAGGWMGGTPQLGYACVYTPENGDGGKPTRELVIDSGEVALVELIFDMYIDQGGNATAEELNRRGYRKPRKAEKYREKAGEDSRPFFASDIIKMVESPLYAGFVTWGKNRQSKYLKDFEPTMIHRPELQIIPIETWERANQERQRRVRDGVPRQKWTNHPFAKLVKCPACDGFMYGISKIDRRGEAVKTRFVYRCHSKSNNDAARCSYRGSIAESVVARAVIPFVAQVLRLELNLDQALSDAAAKYGKTGIEQGLEAEIKAEKVKAEEAKQRVVKAVAGGVFIEEEAAKQMAELRQTEQRLERELVKLRQQDRIRRDYIEAISALKSRDIEATLWGMLDGTQKQRRILGRVLSLIFEPGSLTVTSVRNGNKYQGVLESYQFTEGFYDLIGRTDYEQRHADIVISHHQIAEFVTTLGALFNVG